jgi:uncharacterized protein YjiS (DUF1127 family)
MNRYFGRKRIGVNIAGLHLGLRLRQLNIDCTIMTDRSADQVANAKLINLVLIAARRVRLAPPHAESEHAAAFLRALCRMPHIIRQWFMRVESRRELTTLSDYELRDIGLTRNDVH